MLFLKNGEGEMTVYQNSWQRVNIAQEAHIDVSTNTAWKYCITQRKQSRRLHNGNIAISGLEDLSFSAKISEFNVDFQTVHQNLKWVASLRALCSHTVKVPININEPAPGIRDHISHLGAGLGNPGYIAKVEDLTFLRSLQSKAGQLFVFTNEASAL